MINVLITGASGFVGKNVLKYFLGRSKYSVCCILRRKVETYHDVEHIYLKNPELLSWKDYYKIIYDYDISTMIHIAAITGERRISWEEYYKTNVLWTKNLALSFAKSNVNHRNFIFFSSVGVYGTNPCNLPADEHTPLNPDGFYHISKVMAEKELKSVSKHFDLPITIFRPTIMYGYYDYGFLYKISKLIKKNIFFIFSNPIIHLLDVWKVGYVCDIAIRKRKCGVYNLCDDMPTCLMDVVDFLSKIHQVKPYRMTKKICSITKIIKNNILKMKFKLLCYSWFYDNSKVRKDFGVSFGDTLANLKKYISWYM